MSRSPAIARACHAVALPAEPAEWVHLVPAGRFSGRDGRGPYVLRDAAAVIAASIAAAPDGELQIDYDHATDLAAPNGHPARAAAWIKELQARSDGIWGRVEWTPPGAQAVRHREYRFLSPVFRHHPETGEISLLERAALTNNPNLRQLTALHASTGVTMDLEALLTQLRAALGLPAEAGADQIIAGVKALGDKATAAEKVDDEIATAAGLAKGAKPDDVVRAIQAAIAGKVDPAKWVPIEQVTALQTRLTALEKSTAEEKAAAAVDGAIADGRLLPAMRDWGLQLHASNPAAFADYVAKMPVIVGGTVTTKSALNAAGLDPEEARMASLLGVDAEAFKKAKGSEGGR